MISINFGYFVGFLGLLIGTIACAAEAETGIGIVVGGAILFAGATISDVLLLHWKRMAEYRPDTTPGTEHREGKRVDDR